MILQSVKEYCLAQVGPESIWKNFGALVWSTTASGRFVCGFWTDLHFADEVKLTTTEIKLIFRLQ
jgi:hypothetical protein